MSDLISELAALLVQDNAVLFVGAAWRQEQRPLLQAIAEALAAAMDYRGTDRTLPAIARDFELERGRQALIQTVREVVERQTTALTPLHQVIADVVLPMSKVITTRFDRTLEQALERAGKPYVLIIRDTDLPFFDESKVTLIKMQGDITQPDSLVITEDDIEAFLERLPTLSDVVRAFFATKTLIFLGYDLESAQFKRFYKLVTRRLSAYRRPAYAVTGAPLEPREARYWERENVRLVAEDPEVFLRRLAAAVAALAPAGRAPAAATPTAAPHPAAQPPPP
ncbi:MAG: SIR2 family protein, partial [Caldilineales bacterium]|nr:SIR2 family protein [Caldilineales bacterium]